MKQPSHLSLSEGCNPRFCRPWLVSFAIKEAVGRELVHLEATGILCKVDHHLEATGILCKVDHSDWVAPIVPLPKKDGEFRVAETTSYQ